MYSGLRVVLFNENGCVIAFKAIKYPLYRCDGQKRGL